jgi:Ca2+-binding EF-hand superfamily protein
MNTFQRQKLFHLFSLLDINRNGYLQLNDFEEISERLAAKAKVELGKDEHRVIVQRCVRLFYKLTADIPNITREHIHYVDWEKFFEVNILRSNDKEVLDKYVDLFFDFIFKTFDENNDGYISKKEYNDIFEVYGLDTGYIDKSFDSLDIFRDGRLSRYELKNAIETFLISDDHSDRANLIFGYYNGKKFEK